MKINTRNLSYEQVMALPRPAHKKPRKPSKFLATVVRIVSGFTMKQIKFSYTTERMELVGDKPCLILMNHSSFTDLKNRVRRLLSKTFVHRRNDRQLCRQIVSAEADRLHSAAEIRQ